MPQLVGKPCFGQITAYLRNAEDRSRVTVDGSRTLDSPCIPCKLRDACDFVCGKRIVAVPIIANAHAAWVAAGGHQGFNDRASFPLARSKWSRLTLRVVQHGPFMSSNDVIAQSHAREVAELHLKACQESERLAQEAHDANAGYRKRVAELAERIELERQWRGIQLRGATLSWRAPNVIKRISADDAFFMAEVWAAQAMLIATGMAVTTESLRQTMPPTEHIDPN